MSKRRKKGRTRKHTPRSAVRHLRKKTIQHAREMGDNVKVIKSKLQMSAILLDFIEPYKDEAETLHAFKSLVSIAAFAWNASLMPPGEQLKATQEIAEIMPAKIQASGVEFFTQLLTRKKRHFAHYKRMIAHYEVMETEDSWHVAVVSALTPEEMEQSGYS